MKISVPRNILIKKWLDSISWSDKYTETKSESVHVEKYKSFHFHFVYNFDYHGYFSFGMDKISRVEWNIVTIKIYKENKHTSG